MRATQDPEIAALVKDLKQRGLLASTLVQWGGEMGRLPVIQNDAGADRIGRDHNTYGFSMWLAGGGVRGGTVVGRSDRQGAYPATSPQTPENLAATIYTALGIPRTGEWHDAEGRPHTVYHGEAITGLT